MSEILLNAILHIFAIFTVKLPAELKDHARERVIHYLGNYLGIYEYEDYLGLYDTFLSFYADDTESVTPERAADIAGDLTGKLNRLEQYVLVMRFFEICSSLATGSLATDISKAVMAAFSFPPRVREDIALFCANSPDAAQNDRIGFVNGMNGVEGPSPRVLDKNGFLSYFSILLIKDIDTTYFIKAGDKSLNVDGVIIQAGGTALLQVGTIIRDRHRNPIYYSEIAALLSGTNDASPLCFTGQQVDFRFPDSNNGLHQLSFSKTGGNLIGIMGGSGAGKSTLINILNGSIRPDSGSIEINGLDLYDQKEQLDGVIGVVPQDDLLFEELTVFENLYYNARLCMSNLDHEQLVREVNRTLEDLKQIEIKDLKVGSPLEKTISGGQRKRLNIGLELIRQPTILFVDEPTSGLSSSDSENVMNLLKSQAARGKLVLVVIHQPSSAIFKMFDELWILDRGGRPIYKGNPLDAVTYFKRAVHHAGMEENICVRCGSVNPEQIFEIIELRNLDEYGHFTDERRIAPEKWHALYLRTQENTAPGPPPSRDTLPPPEKGLHRPSLAGQVKIFFQRNLKARLANRQYLLINLLEPPLLAVFIAGLCRGFSRDYLFFNNNNIGAFFFMSVIVSVFLGLSISAEEINRDLRILARERFLNLSWVCYVNSKVAYLAAVTGIQMALYTFCANYIVALPGMSLKMWLVLFSCAMTSCLIGLNISASFKTAVTVYILIPLLIIPQMLLCGVVIKYDPLIPANSGNTLTPWYADLVPARWGYEALVVDQFRTNEYMRHFLEYEAVIRQNEYMTDYHLPEIRSLADYIFLRTDLPQKKAVSKRNINIINSELRILEMDTGIDSILPLDLTLESFDRSRLKQLKDYIRKLNSYYNARRTEAAAGKELVEQKLAGLLGQDGLDALKESHHNSSIKQLVLNELELESVAISGNRLIQRVLPVFLKPVSPSGRAHLYSGKKRLGSRLFGTLHFNIAVLWIMAMAFYLAIVFKLFPRLIQILQQKKH
jgi:ABC transport system ATP-binding/permease protein